MCRSARNKQKSRKLRDYLRIVSGRMPAGATFALSQEREDRLRLEVHATHVDGPSHFMAIPRRGARPRAAVVQPMQQTRAELPQPHGPPPRPGMLPVLIDGSNGPILHDLLAAMHNNEYHAAWHLVVKLLIQNNFYITASGTAYLNAAHAAYEASVVAFQAEIPTLPTIDIYIDLLSLPGHPPTIVRVWLKPICQPPPNRRHCPSNCVF